MARRPLALPFSSRAVLALSLQVTATFSLPSSTLKSRGSDSILGGRRLNKKKGSTFSPSDNGYI